MLNLLSSSRRQYAISAYSYLRLMLFVMSVAIAPANDGAENTASVTAV
jgi:hypothetical protein